ncbi:MAG: autotransporter domain-containing protein [Rhabdochlamydiaceae bacterium]|nr:autotransporter domain-containing protein [Rhabdochlamydiaceae bacterium]
MKHKKALPFVLKTALIIAPQVLEATTWVGGFDSNNLPNNQNWNPTFAPGTNDIGIFDTLNNPPVLLESDSYELGAVDITVDGFQLSVFGDLTLDVMITNPNTTSNLFVHTNAILTMTEDLTSDGVVNYYIDGGDFIFDGPGGSATSNVFLQNASTFTVNNPLVITSLSSSSPTDVIFLSQSLTLSNPDTQTLAGSFNGPGDLNIEGSGILTFTGDSTNSGNVHVTGGTFCITGSMANISGLVISDATLKGTGSLGPVTLTGTSTVAPGGSIGTLTVSSIEFNPSSILQIEIDPNTSSLLNVSGTAILDGTLQIVPDAGSYERHKTYQVINAGNITGQFNLVIGDLHGHLFSLTEEGNSLYLSYEVPLIDTNSLTGNRLTVANYMNEHSLNSTLSLVSSLEGNALKAALDAISPAKNAFGTYIVEQNAFSLSNQLASHIDSKRSFPKEEHSHIAALVVDANEEIIRYPNSSEKTLSTWVSGFGELAHQNSSEQNPAFHYATGGALAGLDYNLTKEAVTGIALGYSRTYFHDTHHMGRGHINSYFTSIYGNAPIGPFYISPAIWGIFNQINNIRNISFSEIAEQAKAHIFSWQLVPHLEAGYQFQIPFCVITPYTSADLAIIWQRGYQEHGASPFNTSQKRNNSSMVRSETGLKFFEKWEKDWGSFMLKEQVSYVFEKPYGIGFVNASLVGTPSSFTVTAVDQNLNLATVGIDFICSIGERKPLQIGLGVKGEFGSNYQLGELLLDVTKRF